MLHFYLKKIQNFFIKKKFFFNETSIDYFFKNKKKTVVSFSSIGRGRKYIQPNEFFNLVKNYNVVFVKDITRSWFNNIDVNYVKSYLKEFILEAPWGKTTEAFLTTIDARLGKALESLVPSVDEEGIDQDQLKKA